MLIKVKLTRSENLDYYGKDEIEIDIEEYLKGVVPAEIGNADLEAGKAQAVVARTFALYRYQTNGSISDKSSTDQAFRTSRFSNSYTRAHQAVEETKGEVLYYNNKIVTNAHYSAMNGGRTYSSEEKWGGKRAYLIAQEDPWDYAISKGKKNGHGVGMSQTGAKYAASIGVKYDAILAFYYPGTEIHSNYGEKIVIQPSKPLVGTIGGQPQGGNIIMSQYEKYTNLHFVEFLKAMVGQPYWYGTCVYKCTTSSLNTKAKQYPSHYTSSRMSQYKSQVSKKMVSADCIGLGKGYNWTYGGEGVIESIGTDKTFTNKYGNNCPDKSANGMFTYAKSKGLKWGKISTIPEVPGLAVRKDGHVGYYIGNGKVVEAYGFAKGIIITDLKQRPWTDWYEFPGIKYVSGEYKAEEPEVKPEVEAPKPIATAIVTTTSGRLNLRASKSTSASILARIPKGQKINIYEREETWSKTYYDGHYGYVANSFLTFDRGNEHNLGERLPLTEGMKGSDIEELQEILLDLGYKLDNYKADGEFGPETAIAVKEFERDNGLIADGIVDEVLLNKLQEAQGKDDPEDDNEIVPSIDFSAYPTIRKGSKNNYVTILQTNLKKLGYNLGTYGSNKDGIDGDYGSKTVTAVRALQKKANIKVDGICGPKTWEALAKAVS